MPPVSSTILFKQLQVEGFNVMRWLAEWPEAFKEMGEWIKEVRTYVFEYLPAVNCSTGYPYSPQTQFPLPDSICHLSTTGL